MSIESILLAAFLLLPLLERLVRFLRERAARASAEAASAPRQQPDRTPPRQPGVRGGEAIAPGQPGGTADAPAAVVMPPLPTPPRHPAVARLSASDRVRADRRSQGDGLAPPSTRPFRPRAGMEMARLADRADLRRAVVLMAVLGSCKALEHEPGRY